MAIPCWVFITAKSFLCLQLFLSDKKSAIFTSLWFINAVFMLRFFANPYAWRMFPGHNTSNECNDTFKCQHYQHWKTKVKCNTRMKVDTVKRVLHFPAIFPRLCHTSRVASLSKTKVSLAVCAHWGFGLWFLTLLTPPFLQNGRHRSA